MEEEDEDVSANTTDNEEKNGFIFHNKKYLITYKGWVEKTGYKAWLNSKLEAKTQIEDIHLAHEVGDKTANYKHTHIAVCFTQQLFQRGAHFLDYPGPWKEQAEEDIAQGPVHPNVQVIGRKNEDWIKVLKYLRKYDKDCAYLDNIIKLLSKGKNKREAIENGIIDRIQNSASINDAVRCVDKLNETPAAIMLYNLRYEEPINISGLTIEMITGWQIQLKNRLEDLGDDRSIIWIYCENGCTGKTRFRQFMNYLHPEQYLSLDTYIGTKDLAILIQKKQQQGWRGTKILMDLSRTEFNYGGIYNLLEKLRNGSLTSGKYSGAIITMNITHLAVFSNKLPNIDALTLDRWEVYEIVTLDGRSTGTPTSLLNTEEKREKYSLRISNTKLQPYNINDLRAVALGNRGPIRSRVASEDEALDEYGFPIGQ
jgi:hypothetical protein